MRRPSSVALVARGGDHRPDDCADRVDDETLQQGIDPFGEIPAQYKLSQNYPNPFNPVTNIAFDIPKYNSVKLEIYDMSGKKIEELVNQNLNAGHYQVQWDASKYSSGAYVSKLTTPDYSATSKMILVK